MIILANGKTTEIAQRTDDTEHLWVRVGELPRATGWQIKPQGMCLGEMCVPLPDAKVGEWIADAEDWVWMCYSEFADMIGQKYVRTVTCGVSARFPKSVAPGWSSELPPTSR